MEFLALVLSVEVTRREARSALPHARVRQPGRRGHWVRAVVRRGGDPTAGR